MNNLTGWVLRKQVASCKYTLWSKKAVIHNVKYLWVNKKCTQNPAFIYRLGLFSWMNTTQISTTKSHCKHKFRFVGMDLAWGQAVHKNVEVRNVRIRQMVFLTAFLLQIVHSICFGDQVRKKLWELRNSECGWESYLIKFNDIQYFSSGAGSGSEWRWLSLLETIQAPVWTRA